MRIVGTFLCLSPSLSLWLSLSLSCSLAIAPSTSDFKIRGRCASVFLILNVSVRRQRFALFRWSQACKCVERRHFFPRRGFLCSWQPKSIWVSIDTYSVKCEKQRDGEKDKNVNSPHRRERNPHARTQSKERESTGEEVLAMWNVSSLNVSEGVNDWVAVCNRPLISCILLQARAGAY